MSSADPTPDPIPSSAMSSPDRRLKEANERIKRLEEQLEQERRGKEEERREKEEAQRKTEEAERKMTKLPFVDFLQHMEDAVFSAFLAEPNKDNAASGTTTNVSCKMYPRSLQRWADFYEEHMKAFNCLQKCFGNQALFMSPFEIETVRKSVNPNRRIADEQDIRPFIDNAIEKPAATIVTAYLNIVMPEINHLVDFQNNAYGRLPRTEPPAKKQSPSKDLMPDRWTFLFEDDDNTLILIGEYKPPRKLKAATLYRVMSSGPEDTFFLEAIRTKQTTEVAGQATEVGGTDNTVRIPGHVLVAQVLCQAYHYMIGSGCEYGYVSSGDSLVFLRVLANSPDTLYYHSVRFSVPPILNADERRRQNAGSRQVHQTPAALIASLCLWATKTTPRSPAWIDDVKANALRWPDTKGRRDSPRLVLRGHPDDEDGTGGVGGGAAGDGPLPPLRQTQQSSPLKRGYSPTRQSPFGSTEHATTASLPPKPYGSYVLEPPTLPYCTQACLGGLVRGLPLDKNCPNVVLHRAARRHAHIACLFSLRSPHNKAALARAKLIDGHPVTMATLQSLVVAQIAANMDKDCECLDKHGFSGRFGVLFKIAVTGYGYTFVGKSVEAVDCDVLAREADVYRAVPHLQGRLIPVFLGVVELVRPIPLRSLIEVSHMMLLSYAGPNLHATKLLPQDVDVDVEADRTTLELEAAGVYNEDIRFSNLAWNAEVRRVMHFDFDQAWVDCRSTPPRSWNANHCGDQGQDQDGGYDNGDHDGRTMKRARAV